MGEGRGPKCRDGITKAPACLGQGQVTVSTAEGLGSTHGQGTKIP